MLLPASLDPINSRRSFSCSTEEWLGSITSPSRNIAMTFVALPSGNARKKSLRKAGIRSFRATRRRSPGNLITRLKRTNVRAISFTACNHVAKREERSL